MGGKKEYVVTVSAIIGNAKMKGVSKIRTLPPYPPKSLDCSNWDNGGNGASIKIR